MDYEREQRRVQQKYTRLHARTLIGTVGGAIVTFIPSLAPFLGSVVPFVAATKYGFQKWDEIEEKHLLTRSLMGVLAAARSGEPKD